MDSPPPSHWLELVGAPLLVLGPGGTLVLDVNMAFRRLLGALTLPALPCPLDRLIGPAAAGELRERVGHGTPGQFGAPLALDCEIGGALRRLTLHVASLPAPADHWLVTLLDVTARPEPESWRNDLQSVLNWLPIGVEILDGDLVSIFSNAHVDQLFGYTKEEVGRVEHWWALAYPDPDYRAQVRAAWLQGIAEARTAGREMVPQEWVVTCKDGSRKTIQFRYRAVGGNHVVVYMDVSLERSLETELRRLADTDALTGLPNRRHFFGAAEAWFATAQAGGEPLSILFLDLDHFKDVNDRYGHAVGDLALRETAVRLRQSLREQDLLARLGGEEFALLLRSTPQAKAREIAERLRAAIADEPVEAGVHSFDLTISIGGATCLPHETQLDPLIERADRSLYAAKDAGRNCVRFEQTAGPTATSGLRAQDGGLGR